MRSGQIIRRGSAAVKANPHTRRSLTVSLEHHAVGIAGRELAIVVRRSDRRTMAMCVDHAGVRVNAPHRASRRDIEAFVLAHGDWALARIDGLRQARAAAAIEVGEGRRLRILGTDWTLRLCPRTRGPRWTGDADGGSSLLLPARSAVEALEKALRERARHWFAGRVAEYCHRLGEAVPKVGLSSARTRWGSCSRKSGIRLHWKLLLLAPELAEYVVAHEVAHLREMNHSERFWRLVSELYPDWRRARAALKAHAQCLPEFVSAGAGNASKLEEAA